MGIRVRALELDAPIRHAASVAVSSRPWFEHIPEALHRHRLGKHSSID